jgi:hypothetical protein
VLEIIDLAPLQSHAAVSAAGFTTASREFRFKITSEDVMVLATAASAPATLTGAAAATAARARLDAVGSYCGPTKTQ